MRAPEAPRLPPGAASRSADGPRPRSATTPGEITDLLLEWAREGGDALARLMPLVYDELRTLAASYLRRERSARSLQTTELIHEAYLRLVDQKRVTWRNRAHFFGIAAQAMRRILIDDARRRLFAKRGGGRRPLSFEESGDIPIERAAELVALDDALVGLASLDAEQAQVVELRYFGGLTSEEIGEVLDCSVPTVTRRWRMARAWLYRQLQEGDRDGT